MTDISKQPETIKYMINKELSAIRSLTRSNNNQNILKELRKKLSDLRSGLEAFSNLPVTQEINTSLSTKIAEIKYNKKTHYNNDKCEEVKKFKSLWNNPIENPNRLYIWAENSRNIIGKVIFDVLDTHKTLYLNESEQTYEEFEILDDLLYELREHNENYNEDDEDDALFGISTALPDGTIQSSKYDSCI